ncbi:inositol polyphosphate 5-phosphatase, partial [Gonapodya sp. JEL0774]
MEHVRKGEIALIQPSCSAGGFNDLPWQPPPPDLSQFVPPLGESSKTGAFYHIISLATQECSLPLEKAVLFPDKSDWEERLRIELGSSYHMIQSVTMAGLHLVVFVHQNCAGRVHEESIRTVKVACGIGNVIGNKGAVAVSFQFGNRTFLFVGAHLCAGRKHVEARNADYRRIEMVLRDKLFASKRRSSGGSLLPDFTFFAGDLNYRVNATRSEANRLLDDGDVLVLWERDQLTQEMAKGRAFENYTEAE